jgi:4-hydroxy-3-polyprenylbenzoate decarboxylase
MKQKLVIAITGASGSIYSRLLLEKLLILQDQWEEIALIFSEKGKEVWKYELDMSMESLPYKIYDRNDFFAPFASGSSDFQTMVICPCSMGTLGRIANGVSDDLISRCADVMLKERRKLILVTRDTPLNLIHLRNMVTITEAGGIICPATPSFYSKPKDIYELVTTVVDRIIALSGFKNNGYKWGED